MGQFSWLDCKNTSRQILDDVWEDVYVLVPKEFGGGHIREEYYDGYGRFGGKDIYDLVADWNREYLSKHPNHFLPYAKRRIGDYSWYPAYADLSKTREEVLAAFGENHFMPEWRSIGIEIACYDEDAESLPYPIKITHDPNAVYETCSFSPSDPNQGWLMEDDEDDDYLIPDEEDW